MLLERMRLCIYTGLPAPMMKEGVALFVFVRANALQVRAAYCTQAPRPSPWVCGVRLKRVTEASHQLRATHDGTRSIYFARFQLFEPS